MKQLSEHIKCYQLPERTFNALKSMPNNKTPGNNGLRKEFYKGFWNE